MEANAWLERMQSVVSTVPSVYGSNEVKVITLHAFLADWIRMPFGVEGGVGIGMGVLDFRGDRPRGRGSLGG